MLRASFKPAHSWLVDRACHRSLKSTKHVANTWQQQSWILPHLKIIPVQQYNQLSISPCRASLSVHLLAVIFSFWNTEEIDSSMLSRGNSDAATRLRRAKSTSSVQTYRPTTSDSTRIDPETAHQHAVVAASHAYVAAQGNGSPHKKAESHKVGNTGEEASQRLERRQSVRFTGPSAVPLKQRSITRRQAPGSTATRPKLHAAASFERHGPELLVQGTNGFVAVPNPSEYVERRVSSTPSSYKKIRKTESMFNPSKAPSLPFMSGSSKNRGHRHSQSLEHRVSENGQPESSSEQHNTSINRRSKIANQDAAVQLARDTYVRQLEQQRLKEKSSFMDFAKPRKTAKTKGFRRTVRTSSSNSYGSAVGSQGSQAQEPSKGDGLGNKARSVSTSLKNRLKRVFQKSSDIGGTIPKQQLDAGRPHFGDYMATSNGVQQRYEHHIPSPDHETLRRVDSRGSCARDTSAFVVPSHPGSIRSIHSDTSSIEAPSRVSSWATSTIGSALASHQARENKRLSIIHEHGGPYQPSSTMRSYGDLSRRYAAFNDPIRDLSAGSLYARLKKEIEQNERVTRLGKENDEASVKPSIADLTPRGSSYKARNLSTGTISEEPSDESDPFTGVRASKSVLFRPTRTGDNRGEESKKDEAKGSPHTGRPPPEDGDLTPKGPLREVKSAFFPPSTRLERRETSPYRRAMASSSEEGTIIRGPGTLDASTMTAAETKPTGFLHVRSISRSDSIYSRTTSGNTPAASPSPPSLSDSENDRGIGVAIVDSKAVKYEKASSPTKQSRRSSAKSSGEWGRWLSHEVEQLERRTLSPSDGEVSPASTIGHKREGAQMDGDDVEVGKLQPSNRTAQQLFPVFHETTVLKPVTKSQFTEILADRVPLADIGSTRLSPRKEQPPSQIPQPSSPRARPSHASLTNTSSNLNLNKRFGLSLKPPSRPSDTLRTAASSGQLRAQGSESSSSRQSPEREARLRRMQSSNSVEQRRQQENKSFGNVGGTPSPVGGRENARPSLAHSSSADGHSPGSQLMIERFLNNRRKDMQIGEESGGDPVFL